MNKTKSKLVASTRETNMLCFVEFARSGNIKMGDHRRFRSYSISSDSAFIWCSLNTLSVLTIVLIITIINYVCIPVDNEIVFIGVCL